MYTGVRVKYRYSCRILMKLVFSRQIFDQYSNIKFHEIRTVEAELFDTDGRRDILKLMVAFRNFANTPFLVSASVACQRMSEAARMREITTSVLRRKYSQNVLSEYASYVPRFFGILETNLDVSK